MDADKKAKQKEQIGKAEKLQDMILDDFIQAIENKTATATDRATIVRLLKDNGWTLDPAQIPSTLRDKLTKAVSFDADLTEEEAGEQRRLRAI